MTKKKYLTSDEKMVNAVLDAFLYSKNYFSSRFNKFQEWAKLYNQISSQRTPFRSNLFIPLVYPIVSTVLPRMVANLPKFRYEPREESDAQNVKQMSTLVDYQLDRMDFFKKLKMWVKDTLMFGTGIVKVYWRRDEEDQYNDPDLDVCDIFELYVDPKASEIDGGDFIIHRSIAALDFLERQKTATGEDLYKNLDKVRSEGNVERTSKVNILNNRAMTVGEIGGEISLGSPYRQSITKQVELLEYWGMFDEKEMVITVANRNIVIRSEENPYKGKRPFIKMHTDPQNHEFYGKGLIEPIEYLQYELNDIRNQRMDNINLILNKLFVVIRQANVDEQDLVSRPGGVIYSDLPGGVTVLETADVTSNSYNEESLVKQDAQNAVGVSDIIQGQLKSASESVPGQVLNKTATGAAIAVQQAGSRFKYYMQNIEDALREFGLKTYQYNQLFMSEDKMIRVEAPNDYKKVQKASIIDKIKGLVGVPQKEMSEWEFKRVSPDEINNLKLDVKVEAGSTQPVEDTVKQQKVMNLIAMLGQMPVVTPETFLVLAEKVLDAYDVPDKERILQTLQAPQGKQEQPKISVALRGDLNPFEVADIAKQAGATEQSTDPRLVASLKAQEETQAIKEKVAEHSVRGMIQSKLQAEQAGHQSSQMDRQAGHQKELAQQSAQDRSTNK